jgi:hypothetical protein
MRVHKNQQDHPQVSNQSDDIDEEEGDKEGVLKVWVTGQSQQDEICYFCSVLHQCYL